MPYSVIFGMQDIYQGMPLQVAWAISGASSAATARAELSIQGNVFWASQPLQLPMPSIQHITVPPPADPAVAVTLYGNASGARTLHLDVTVTDVNGTAVYGADADVFILEPVPILETVTGIAPGTPMRIFWALDTIVLNSVPAAVVDATAQVLLDAPTGSVVIADIPSTALMFGAGHTFQQFSWVIPPPYAAIGYAAGLHTISLVITLTSGGYRRSYSTTGGYAVLLEKVDTTFWQWMSPAGQIFTPTLPPPDNTPFLKAISSWNTPYVVAGRVVNNASMSVFRASVDLLETPDWEVPPPPTSPLSTVNSVTIGPLSPGENNATGDAVFPAQVQNYSWLDEATGLFSQGAMRREVTYFASVTLTDSFGNTYPTFQSNSLSVDVSVPDSKLSAAITARAELALAVFFAVVASESEIFFGGAASVLSAFLYVEFQQNIGNAKDPPKPNSQYRKMVDLKRRRIPAALNPAGFSSLRELLRMVSLASHSQAALSKIESRLLGAERAKDLQGMQLQHSSYIYVLDQLRAVATTLPQAASFASGDIVNLMDQRLKGRYRALATTFRKRGLTSDLRDRMAEAGVPGSVLEGIQIASNNNWTREALPLVLDKGSAQLITELSQAVAALAESILEEAPQRSSYEF